MSLIYKIMLFTLSFHLPPDHRIWWTNVDISTFEAWLLLSSRCWGNCVLRQFSRVQLLSCVWLFATPWTAAYQASLFITNSWSLLKLMSIESVMPSNHLILCHPFLLLSSVLPSIRVFFSESVLCSRWPKDWNFSFSISPSNEYSGLISFRMDWFDLLASKGLSRVFSNTTIFKTLILQCSAFFKVQFPHFDYIDICQ